MYTSSWNNRTRADKKGSTLRRLARRTSSNSVRAEHRYKDGDRRNGGNQNSAGVADGQGCVCFEGRARGADRSLSSWSARANVARRSRRQLERPWTTTTPSTQHTTSAHDFVRARARERERSKRKKAPTTFRKTLLVRPPFPNVRVLRKTVQRIPELQSKSANQGIPKPRCCVAECSP